MAWRKNPLGEASFGHRFAVRRNSHLRPSIIAYVLLAMQGPLYAADDSLGRDASVAPASESGEPTPAALPDRVVGTSLCPAPNAIWEELVTLLPQEHLISRLRALGKEKGSIRVDDLGAMFRISVLDKVREYREEARDCGRRARMGALFSALIIDPVALLSASSCENPPCPSAPLAKPPVPVEANVSPALPPPSLVRIELGPALVVGLGTEDHTIHGGGAIRLGLGRGSLGLAMGMAGLWPADTSIGGVHLRQWRLPIDLGIRATARNTRIDFYGELGLVLALLRERALELETAKSRTGVELGGRVGLGARLARRKGFTPFVGVQADLFPDPPRVDALPVGDAGRTPYIWIGACVGASWGI